MAFWSLAALRSILATETDADSPGSEELLGQLRENWEALTMLAFDTGITTTSTAIAEEVFTDAGSPFANVEVDMTLLITSGTAIGNTYRIDATNGTTTVTCTGDTLVTDGVIIGDTAKVMFDLLVNTDGHDHDGVNSKEVVLADDQVVQAKIADNAVGQAQLKDATSAQSVQVTAGASDSIALTGSDFGWISFSAQDPGAAGTAGIEFGHDNTAAGTVGFYNSHAVTDYYAYTDQRYFTASPPYDLGDGEIPLFIYILMDSLGNQKGISVGRDPTWAYHGPTNIIPTHTFNGKPYREFKMLEGLPFAEAIKDPVIADRYMKEQSETTLSMREITHAVKNQDMDIFPHPYVYNDLTGITPILLDPMSPIMERLFVMKREVGATEILKLIEAGYLNIGNEAINRKCPSALMPVAFSWK